MAHLAVADYSWQHPSTEALTAGGYGAVVRYLARKVDAKLLQAGEVQRLHAAGIGIGLVWETTAARAGEGATAGAADVAYAEGLADKLGAPAGCPIFYAVDFDATADAARPYFAAILAAAVRPVGVYGSYRVVEGLPEVPWVWQTVAWSQGRISERCHLYQRGSRLAGTDHNIVYQQVPFWIAGGQVMLINPTVGRISRGFSATPVVNPATGASSAHLGVDIAAPVGTPIKAIAAGKVKSVRTNSYAGDTRAGLLPGRTGNGVYITHEGFTSYSGHCSTVLVKAGDTVAAGQTIALVGATGMVTGPHNHQEIHVNGTAVDPVPFLAARGVTAGTDPYSVAYIKEVQRLLNDVDHAKLAEDGDLGAKTIAAVRAYQLTARLAVDGDPGPKTLAALRVAANPPPAPPAPPTPTPTPQEDTMPTAEQIAAAVWAAPVTIALPDGTEQTETAGVWLAWGNRHALAAMAGAAGVVDIRGVAADVADRLAVTVRE